MTHTLLIALLSGAYAADDDAPRYLLGDVGVRIDLPDNDGWDNIEWADWQFKADAKGVILYAWTAPLQVTPTEADLDAWGAHAAERAEGLGGASPKVRERRVGTRHGQPSVELTIDVDAGRAGPGVFHAVGFPVRGQVFFVSTMTSAKRSSVARRALDEIVDAVEVRTPAAELTWGGEMSTAGVSYALPEGWRLPIDTELPMVAEALANRKLPKRDDCVTAIRPVAGRDPGVLMTCPESLDLGIVDEYTFDSVDAQLHDTFFRGVEMAAPERLQGSDRPGFLYQVPFETISWFQVFAPTADGVVSTWAVGDVTDELALSTAARRAVVGASLGPAPAVSIGDRVSYYLKHRPLHPFVLVPVAVMLLGIVLVIGAVSLIVLRGRKNRYALDDEGV